MASQVSKLQHKTFGRHLKDSVLCGLSSRKLFVSTATHGYKSAWITRMGLSLQICDDVFWQNYKKFRDEEQKIMQAELAKVQQAMQMQQPGSLPMPWDGATPPAGRVSYSILL